LVLVNVSFIFSYIIGEVGLDKRGSLMIIFAATTFACVLLIFFLAILEISGFAAIDPKDLNDIISLVFVVGLVSILGVGAVVFDESGRIGAIVLAIFIAAIAYAIIFTGVILTEKPAAEKTVTETEKTKTVTERTVTVTQVAETKTLQKKEVTWLDTFMVLLGFSLIIAMVTAYSYALWTDP
jgi:glucan phosphoethanolaminetransferase (alkaline phosphatase superfamily)